MAGFSRRRYAHGSWVAFVLMAAWAADRSAAATGQWQVDGPSADWFDPLNWTGGVPQSAGDVAQFSSMLLGHELVHLTAPATLGELVVSAPGDLTIEGQTLRFESPSSASPRIVNNGFGALFVRAPIDLVAGQTLTTQGGRLNLIGPISGAGNVAYLGNVVIAGDNSYTGVTTLDVDDGRFLAHSPTAFGSPIGETRVRNGLVFVYEGSAEPFVIERNGSVFLHASAEPHTGKITLEGGRVSSYPQRPSHTARIESEIAVRGLGLLGGNTSTAIVTDVRGPVTGDGLLVIDFDSGSLPQDIRLNGPVSLRGNILSRFHSNVTAAGEFNPAGDLVLQFNGGFRFEGERIGFQNAIDTRGGFAVVATDLHTSHLRLAIDHAGRTIYERTGGVVIEPGATLTAERVDFLGGSIKGRLAGVDTLVKTSAYNGSLERLEGFGGAIEVRRGVVEIRDAAGLGTTAGATSVTGARDAALVIPRGVRLEETVHLNNVSGVDFQGGVIGQGELAGDLYLGDAGSYVGGLESGASASDGRGHILTLSGRIHGGALRKTGASDLLIAGAGHTYFGPTEVLDGTLSLRLDGRLESTERIVIDGGRTGRSDSNTTRLAINSYADLTNVDRIADDIPIDLHNADLEYYGNAVRHDAQESLGEVTLQGGVNRILADEGVLRLGALVREANSVAQFALQNGGRIDIVDAELSNGLLGGWATVATRIGERPVGFATIRDGSIAEAPSIQRTISGSTAEQNIRVAAGETLDADATVNSIVGDAFEPWDLGGHRLTIASGGLIARNSIRNGELTAGRGNGPGELFLHSPFADIEAAIVDNGGPLTVHASGEFRGDLTRSIHLEGQNTYTGGTIISGGVDAHILRREAVPVGDELTLNGAFYHLDFEGAGEPLAYDRITLRGGAIIDGTNETAAIDARQYDLFAGTIGKPIVGDGVITKRGEGRVELTANSPGFTGPIAVEQGVLAIGSQEIGSVVPTEATAIHVMPEGVFEAGIIPDERLVILEGGEIALFKSSSTQQYKAPIEVRGGGRVRFLGASSVSVAGRIFGQGDLTIVGGGDAFTTDGIGSPLDELDGDLIVDGGDVSLGADNSAFTGRVIVRSGHLNSGFHGLGPAGAIVESGGRLSSPSRGEGVDGPIQLAGGVLRYANTIFNGLIDVTDNSLVERGADPVLSTTPGFLTLVGGLRVADNVTLKKYGPGELSVPGPISVGPGARLIDWEGNIRLQGEITARGPNSSLDLVGNDYVVESSVNIPAGASFTLLRDGAAIPLPVVPGAQLAGAGTVNGDVQVDGGSVAPGASAGTLRIAGDLTIGPGSVYQWELADHAGEPGGPAGWDLLEVDGKLTLGGTPAAPWTLALAAWSSPAPGEIAPAALLGSQSHEWLMASAPNIVGFDPAAVIIDDSALVAARPELAAGFFHVTVDGGNLRLNYAVPEPSSGVLLAWGAGLVALAPCRARLRPRFERSPSLERGRR